MNRTANILTALMLGFSGLNLYAQERIDVPVMTGDQELVMPWNGGYNAPQFANIDLNRDGVTDMISFDRQGDILRTYLRLPASGRWIMDWQYTAAFPELVDWVQVVDFDNDGIEDLFTSSSPTGAAGISVYKGAYANGLWSFSLLKDRGVNYLQVMAGQGLANLYVSWEDIPAITDVDGDGDIDVLAFEPGGSFISYFSNQSIENGWGRDSLRYKLEDVCWGKILENELNESVYLSDNPDVCSDGNYTGEDHIIPRHAGSTIMALDIDFDGDKDAWVGDISSRRLVFLLNGLTAQEAWIIEQESHWPVQDTAVNLPYFVAAYSVQLDDDPEPELVAAINSRSLTKDVECVWRYDDDINDGPLNFKLTEKGFFQNEMIDIGSHSRPAVSDINGDGLQDLVMGGYRYAEGALTRIPSLWVFENQGSADQPYFVRVSEDYLEMSQYGNFPTFDFAPAFGDLDGNGTIDLVVGDQNGKLFFFKNNAGPSEVMNFESPVYPYMSINVGVSATPQIVDINGDGLGDLVVGERTGNADNSGRCSNLNYFENRGSEGSAMFLPDATVAPNTQCFGRVLFDIPIGLPQHSTPNIVRTKTGLILLTGSDRGDLLLFDHVQNGKTGAISLVDDQFGFIKVGYRSAPALADINNDGKFELIVGNQRGGLELFSTELEVGVTSVVTPGKESGKPYFLQGNLSQGIVDLHWKNGAYGTVQLYDLLGRHLKVTENANGAFVRFDLTDKTPGFYLLQIRVGDRIWIEKVVKE